MTRRTLIGNLGAASVITVAEPTFIPVHRRTIVHSLDDIIEEFLRDLYPDVTPGVLNAAEYAGEVRLRNQVAAAINLGQNFGVPMNRFDRVMDATERGQCPFPEKALEAERDGMGYHAPVTRSREYPPFASTVHLVNMKPDDPANNAGVDVQVGGDAFQRHTGDDLTVVDAAADMIRTRYNPSRADFLKNSSFLYNRVIDVDRNGSPLFDEGGQRSSAKLFLAHGGANLLVQCGCQPVRKARLLYPGQTPVDFHLI